MIPWRFTFAAILATAALATDAAGGDDAFLDDLQQRGFRYFWEEASPRTGLIYDRADADGVESRDRERVASIAAVGFGLTAICIAQERGWITRDEAHKRIVTTLRFLWNDCPHVRGFYYHFVDMDTGERRWDSELSTIDTALLMAGVLTARQAFQGTEIEELATRLYERVEWPWMLTDRNVLSMGWTPEGGFLKDYWGYYAEHKILYLLGLGSRTHPLPPEVWHAWRREPVTTYGGRTFLSCPPLFTHQYSQNWIDFRNKRDAYADYHENSRLATLAQRRMFVDLSDTFPAYGTNLWGLTASDSPDGYKAWGGPPATAHPPIDGTVTPYAAGGSISFAPEESIATLRYMKDVHGDIAWKRYSFIGAFNPHTGWREPDVIGIDVGVTVMAAENHRSGYVWNTFMSNPEIRRAMRIAGFVDTSDTLSKADERYLKRLARDTWRSIEDMVHSKSGLPCDTSRKEPHTSVSNIGLYLTAVAAAHEMGFISRGNAERKIRRALDALKQLPTWHGFQQSWNRVDTLEPTNHDTWISILDSGNLVAGLLTVGQCFPEFYKDSREIVDMMQWNVFYDAERNRLLGGYDRAAQRFNPDWTLPSLGSDSRLASFLAVATGAAPPASWDALDRATEERHNAQYLAPGWQGGGLFMQFISGLWLDDRDTLMEQSARNFAYAQIRHAAVNRYPAWGWSASDSPDGEYLGWGRLRDDVVTPHASALAIGHFPNEVVRNLRKLEEMGARSPKFGFLDSINIISSRRSEHFLMLDQCMLFLSLANYLHDGVVRDWFQADPLVRKGRALIADYRDPSFATESSLYTLHPPPPDIQAAQPREARAPKFDKWERAAWNEFNAREMLETGDPADAARIRARFAFAWDKTHLHFRADVDTPWPDNRRDADTLFEESSVELYINPAGDGLRWGHTDNFQFGFAATDKVWEWFGRRHDQITANTVKTDAGYRVTARIPWTLLAIEPAPGATLDVSVGVKSLNPKDESSVKLVWSWRPAGDVIRLGRLTLE